MSKLFNVLIIGLFCTSAAKLCHALYVVRVENSDPLTYLDPIKMQKKQMIFQRICSQKPICREYGSPKLMESLDTGRIRPKQRRKIRHQTLDKIQQQVDIFPSPELKQYAIKNINKRIITLKKSIY